MQDPGEEIVGEFLKHIRGCDFVEYNLQTPDVQGEIDVVAINTAENIVYVCEVATHLITGLLYVKKNQPDNIDRFVSKFGRSIPYTIRNFPTYERRFMLWSPIVKTPGPKAKHNQSEDIVAIRSAIETQHGVIIDAIVNERYAACLAELRAYAANETKALNSPILRLMQIEERLNSHLD